MPEIIALPRTSGTLEYKLFIISRECDEKSCLKLNVVYQYHHCIFIDPL